MLTQVFNKAGEVVAEGAFALEQAIGRERPDVNGLLEFMPDQGKLGFVLHCEDEVFKGPRRRDQVMFVQQECRILKHLEGKGLSVPVVTTVGKHAVFFGMLKVPGLSLQRGWLESMTFADRDALAADLAQFMADFNRAFTDEDEKNVLHVRLKVTPEADKVLACIKDSRVQSLLGDNLEDCCRHVEKFLEDLPKKPRVLMHHDLNPGNIMVDADTNKLTAVIDFGYVTRGIPECALMAPRFGMPAPFVEKLCEEYSNRSGNKVEYKDVLRFHAVVALVALSGAVNTGNENDIVSLKRDISGTLQELRVLERRESAPAAAAKGGLRHP